MIGLLLAWWQVFTTLRIISNHLFHLFHTGTPSEPNNGRLFCTISRQICWHTEGERAEENTTAAGKHIEPGANGGVYTIRAVVSGQRWRYNGVVGFRPGHGRCTYSAGSECNHAGGQCAAHHQSTAAGKSVHRCRCHVNVFIAIVATNASGRITTTAIARFDYTASLLLSSVCYLYLLCRPRTRTHTKYSMPTHSW